MTTMRGLAGFSCDLLGNAIKHREFLRKIHALGESNLSNVETLRRYRDLWLPLVNSNSDKEMVPPPDVAWLWHCHRLAPFRYMNYVRGEFGKIVEANPPFALQLENEISLESDSNGAAACTRELWQERYPTEPFFYALTDDGWLGAAGDQHDLAGFDLLSSSERQATFLWQVSGARFEDTCFLQCGVANYLKFLRLRPRAQSEGVVLVPTYQIDLMWHTHILSSITLYNYDCEAIIGSRLHHDDSLGDRRIGGLLDRSFRATVRLWESAYKDNYIIPGGMYRGEPPGEYYSRE